jgi:hypothetical protein
MYTNNFWTICPWKNPVGKISATYLDFIIIEKENIDISYNKISLAKYKTSSTNVWSPSANTLDQICRKRPKC